MANVAVSDKTHEEIREMAYRMRTDMKTVIEKAWAFANTRKDKLEAITEDKIGLTFEEMF